MRHNMDHVCMQQVSFHGCNQLVGDKGDDQDFFFFFCTARGVVKRE